MGYLEITGGTPLCGEIDIQGSKNAALPILAACLLGEGSCVIENCPVIGDVKDTLTIMEMLGCRVRQEETRVRVGAPQWDFFEIKGVQAARIRSSVLFLGALLGKIKRAVLPLPGGCAIGGRPIDLHLKMLTAMGAEFSIAKKIEARTEGLRGVELNLPIPSVGATENVILAATQAEGETVLHGAAREPEIDALCDFLNCRGARICRERDGTVRVSGGYPLGPVVYRMGADRIVAGTYLLAAAGAGGHIRLRGVSPGEQMALLRVLREMGTKICCEDQAVSIESSGALEPAAYVETAPYPGFPTDLQSPLMAALCRAKGKSRIRERIFENRFNTAKQLCKMGAQITLAGDRAVILGGERLRPAYLDAPDLRGGAALVIAALQAEGISRIYRTEYIRRGYEDICRDLRLLGAAIEMHK